MTKMVKPLFLSFFLSFLSCIIAKTKLDLSPDAANSCSIAAQSQIRNKGNKRPENMSDKLYQREQPAASSGKQLPIKQETTKGSANDSGG